MFNFFLLNLLVFEVQYSLKIQEECISQNINIANFKILLIQIDFVLSSDINFIYALQYNTCKGSISNDNDYYCNKSKKFIYERIH